MKRKISAVPSYNKEKLSVRDLAKCFHIRKSQTADIFEEISEPLNKWYFM